VASRSISARVPSGVAAAGAGVISMDAQLLEDAGVLVEHALQGLERLGLADVRRARDVLERLHAAQQRRDVAGRRLALEIDDDADAIAPLGDGATEIRRQRPEAAERDQGERDEHDRARRDPSGAPEIPQRLAEQEGQH
jgi:hypothetical protein